MAIAASLKVTKQFDYRGENQRFSNRYHFIGDEPTTDAEWEDLADSIAAQEQDVFTSDVTIVQVDGVPAGTEIGVFSKLYTLAGTATPFAARVVPGDVAALVRYETNVRTSNNHPKYGFNYYHGVVGSGARPPDEWNPAQLALFETYASAWVTGQAYSGGTVTRSLPGGASVTSRLCEVYLTHRDFPR